MISFIGAGRVSKAMGKYFHSKGLEISGYYSLKSKDCEEVSKITESRVFDNLEDLVKNSKIIFISVNDDNILFGLLRLRITKDRAMIRELHVYGQAIELGKKSESEKGSQHKGFGKWLMDKAEEIAKGNGYKKLYVLSGIGVREYYKKLGYSLEGAYVVKKDI